MWLGRGRASVVGKETPASIAPESERKTRWGVAASVGFAVGAVIGWVLRRWAAGGPAGVGVRARIGGRRRERKMKSALLTLVLVVGACGAHTEQPSGGVGGQSGSPAANAGGGNHEAAGGDGDQAQGGTPLPGAVVHRCGCGAGAQPPPECASEPTPGSGCAQETFEICRVGFTKCFFCFAPNPVGCFPEN